LPGYFKPSNSGDYSINRQGSSQQEKTAGVLASFGGIRSGPGHLVKASLAMLKLCHTQNQGVVTK